MTKIKVIIDHQDKIIFEVEEYNKSLGQDVKKFKHMEIEYKSMETAYDWTGLSNQSDMILNEKSTL